jgi:hypothetical protein
MELGHQLGDLLADALDVLIVVRVEQLLASLPLGY